MTLRERLKTEETVLGKILINGVCYIGIVASVVGESMIYLNAIPPDWIPMWVRQAIPVCALVGGVLGKLTAKIKKDEQV